MVLPESFDGVFRGPALEHKPGKKEKTVCWAGLAPAPRKKILSSVRGALHRMGGVAPEGRRVTCPMKNG